MPVTLRMTKIQGHHFKIKILLNLEINADKGERMVTL
jgi:hypothetical protein